MENQVLKRPRLSETLPNRKPQYKTELCLRFQKGNCDYGDRCCFAHGNGDLRRQELVVAAYENQNPKCTDKSKLCWRFMNGEKCQFGDRCHFYHTKIDRKSVSISLLNGAGNDQMQQQKQTPWKTRLCNRWMLTGSCNYGPKCCFAHGESDLQKQGPIDAQDYAQNALCEWIDSTQEKQVDGKRWGFKWKDVEKIGRVYADWIDDLPLNHGETANVAS